MKKCNGIGLIEDLIDIPAIIGISFMLIVIGVWLLPQLPEKVHLPFSLSILLCSYYFIKKIIDFIILKYQNKNDKQKRKRNI